jgi:4,5-DOPA dioxygenase extradiol
MANGMQPLPALFLSHGSPMHAIAPGAAGEAWAALARDLARPSAILMVTAHWESQLPMLSGHPQPPTLHDFAGFPAALRRIRYPAPGDPGLAARARRLLESAGLTAGIDGCRGFDHGTWVPLLAMYPGADIPVVQLSVQPSTGPGCHLDLGRALAPLRDEGVLIIGSGHLTHNLADWMAMQGRRTIAAYAEQFRQWVRQQLVAGALDQLARYRREAPHATRAHPTEEHFLPLFVALGAARPSYKSTLVFEGVEGAALAMDAYRFD